MDLCAELIHKSASYVNHDNKVCYLHSAPRVKRETRILPIGSVPLGPNFTDQDHPLPKC